MATETEADIRVLQAEIKHLRADFAGLTETLRDVVRHGSSEAATKARVAGERVWQTAKDDIHYVGQGIKDKPAASAAIAFGVGIVLGMLFSVRRA